MGKGFWPNFALNPHVKIGKMCRKVMHLESICGRLEGGDGGDFTQRGRLAKETMGLKLGLIGFVLPGSEKSLIFIILC